MACLGGQQTASWRRRGCTHLVVVLAALVLAACAGRIEEPVALPVLTMPEVTPAPEPLGASAHIVETSGNLQCVAYARSIGAVQIYGDAWTWWDAAEGLYSRGSTPQVGAVLVLKKRGASLGHIAVIRQIIDSRTVIAEHANWLNRGEIEMNSPIRDVSPNNDWSEVRVWYVPAMSWGVSVYPAYGFIYPERMASL